MMFIKWIMQLLGLNTSTYGFDCNYPGCEVF